MATRLLPGLRHEGSRTPLRCTSFHGFQGAAICYPNFYPNRQRSGAGMLYLLVTPVNWRGVPECFTSLPSWSCGFDPRRPLSTSIVSVNRCGADVRLSDLVFPLVHLVASAIREGSLCYWVEETGKISLFCDVSHSSVRISMHDLEYALARACRGASGGCGV